MILLREFNRQIESVAREQEKCGWQSHSKSILFFVPLWSCVLRFGVWGLENGEGTTTTQRHNGKSAVGEDLAMTY